MLKNYLVIAFRTLRRQKGYAALNVTGLGIGIAGCLLIGLFVRHELSFDRFHPDADRLFRVLTTQPAPDGDLVTTARGAHRLGPELEETFAAVDRAVRIATADVEVVAENEPREESALFADPAFFEVFAFPLLGGDAATALAQPDGVVLSASAATRLLGDTEAVGRSVGVELDGETRPFTVTAVAEDAPAASSIDFDVVLPIEAYAQTLPAMARSFMLDRWDSSISVTFVRLTDAAEAGVMEAELEDFVAERYAAESPTTLALQPLRAVHLSPDIRGGLTPPGNPLHAAVLGGIAALVLLIACINFTTLALGRSVRRAREVGVRKTLGAHRGQIRRQFWGEALVTTAAATALALVFAALFLPTFNRLTGLSLALDPLVHPAALPAALALVAGVALLAGSYPALVLSRMRPASVLKGRAGLGGTRFARALVVVQFALSIALVAVTIVVTAQVRYLDTAPLGFEREGVVVLKAGGSEAGRTIYPRLRDELGGHAAVRGLTGSFVVPFDARGWPAQLQLGDTASVTVQMNSVDEHFAETMGLEIVAGQDLDAMPTGDGVPVLVNEALLRTLGWADFRGKRLPLRGGIVSAERAEIVGVVRDFHIQPFHEAVEPVILVANVEGGVLAVSARVTTDDLARSLGVLEAAWHRAAPGVPFEPMFLDEVVAEAYESERRWQALLRWATAFALALAGLGLLGVAALSVAGRTKEIGIRKTLGASVAGLVALISADFLRLVAIGFVVAAPLAWLAARRWLEGFAYRIDLGIDLFLLAGALVLGVALLTVAGQALRAATADPVDALRSE
jgi:putative ABC transport system permease protein